MKRFYLIFIACLFTVGLFAQLQEEPQEDPVPEDTTKLRINTWKLTDYYTKTKPVSVDTVLTGIQLYNPVYNSLISATYTGNLGDPALSNIFYERFEEDLPHFMEAFRWYFREPEEIIYVNTTKPFTEVGYSFVPGIRDKDEQTATITHTQNVNPKLNVGFKYDYINARGQYKRQRNTLGQATFYSSYRGNRYELHGNLNIGSFQNQYNGGIEDSLFLSDEVNDTKNYPVRLNEASSETKSRSLLIAHKLYFGGEPKSEDDTVGFRREDAFAFISHAIEANVYKRTYMDEFSGSADFNDLNFYDTAFFNDEYTRDSAYQHSIKNTFSMELFEKSKYLLPVGLNVGIENELEKYHSITIDTNDVYIAGNKNTFFNTALVANAYHQTGEFLNWKAQGGLYFTGRKADDYFLKGDVVTTIKIKETAFNLNASADLSKTTPDYFFNHLVSNHFNWSNNLDDITKLELGASLSNRDFKFSIGAISINMDNYVYFDENADVAQTGVPLSVLTLYLKKRMDLWKFVWNNNIHYQVTDRNNILALPQLAAYSSFYFDHVIRFRFTNGAIFFQIGADVFYNSKHYAHRFMPAFEQYYIQDVREIGNYLFIDPFLNVQIKRTRVYLKYENVGEFFMEKEYYSALYHPRNLGVLKFGIYWNFYD